MSEEVVVRRVVHVPREVAFELWTSPQHVQQWWSPTNTARCTLCEIDLRVGGRYRLDMNDPADGTHCEVDGEFREIVEPKRIVYTWNARTHQGDVSDALVTVEFHALGDQTTKLVIIHSGLPDEPIREGHQEGWEKMLASYSQYLASSQSDVPNDFCMRLVFDVSADRLCEQFSSAEGVAHWWTTDCDFEPRVGGKAAFRFGDSGFYANMEVTRLDRPQLVEWHVMDARHPEAIGFSNLNDWNGTKIRFEIEPLSDNQSRLIFTHVGLGPLECSTVCSNLWGYFLNDSLRAYLEQGTGKPSVPERMGDA